MVDYPRMATHTRAIKMLYISLTQTRASTVLNVDQKTNRTVLKAPLRSLGVKVNTDFKLPAMTLFKINTKNSN